MYCLKVKCEIKDKFERFHIDIINQNGFLVYNCNCIKGQKWYQFNLLNRYYTICITPLNKKIFPKTMKINVDNTCNKNIIFVFFIEKYIKFTLTDKNYPGLKIERSELVLWENHILLL